MTHPTQSQIQSAITDLPKLSEYNGMDDPNSDELFKRSFFQWYGQHGKTIRQVLEQSLWRDISDAPDGRRILVYNGAVHEWYRNCDYWFNNAGEGMLQSLYPTKWRELPAPPENSR